MPKTKVKKKVSKKNNHSIDNNLTFAQKSSDWIANMVGSWAFIISFFVFMAIWICLNAYYLIFGVWDPYPFILLNFVLSCLAAIQAPIILMSQNRQTERDRMSFKYDYQVNRKAEREISHVLKELVLIKKHVYENLGVQIKKSNSKKRKKK
jgi:uncharacterized membrane protein